MDANGLVIKLIVGGEQRDLDKELEVDMINLSQELAAQPAWYAFYAALLAEAQLLFDEEKRICNTMYAQVSSETRLHYKVQSLKITEKQLEEEVLLDNRIQASESRLLRKKRTLELLKVAVKSFEQRLQSLITIAHREKALSNVDPTIRGDRGDRRSYAVPTIVKQVIPEELNYDGVTVDEFLKELENSET